MMEMFSQNYLRKHEKNFVVYDSCTIDLDSPINAGMEIKGR